MTLKERNEEQARIALQTYNRYKYYLEHGDKYPSDDELILFYIENNAEQYSKDHGPPTTTRIRHRST